MSAPQTEIRDLGDLFVYDLGAAYDMEVKLVDALDDLSERATNDDLAAGFALHRTETERQVQLVEEAFEALGAEPVRRENPIVDGLLEDRERFDAKAADDELRNFRYLLVGLQTERVEITAYEGLLLTAASAGLGSDVTEPLEAVLEQERKTHRKLEGLAGRSDFQILWKKVTDRWSRESPLSRHSR